MSREKNFLNEIRGLRNVDGEETYYAVRRLLSEENNKKGLLAKFRKSGTKIVQENFKEIISRTNRKFDDLLNVLIQSKKFDKEIINNLNIIVKKLNEQSNIKNFMNSAPELLKRNEMYIEQNVEQILQIKSEMFSIDTALLLRGISAQIDEKIDREIKENIIQVAKTLLMPYAKEEENIDSDGYAETLSIIIKEILKSENKRYIDISKVGEGAYSMVFAIGDRILKIGKPRETYNIPNSKRILQPMLRKNFKNKYGRPFATIEVSNAVDVNISDEEKREKGLYGLYKALREDGIIWADAKWENVGKLKSRNIPVLNNREYNVDPNAVGFDKALEGEPLEAGELVVLDTDWLYPEGARDVFVLGLSATYGRRYQKEKEVSKQDNTEKEYDANEIPEPPDGIMID